MAKSMPVNRNPSAHIRAVIKYLATGCAPEVPGSGALTRAVTACHDDSADNPMNAWVPRDITTGHFEATQRDHAHWAWKTGEEAARSARREQFSRAEHVVVVADPEQSVHLRKNLDDFLQAAKDLGIDAPTLATHLPWLCFDSVPMVASALVFLGADPRSEAGLALAQKLVGLRAMVRLCGLAWYSDLKPVLNASLEALHGPNVNVPSREDFPNRDVRLTIVRRGEGVSRQSADIQLRPAVAQMYSAIMAAESELPTHHNNERQGAVVGALVTAILVLMPWAMEDREAWTRMALNIAAQILAAPKTYLAATDRGPLGHRHLRCVLAGVIDMATRTAPAGARLPVHAEILTATCLLGICLGSNWWLSRDIHERISAVANNLFSAAGVLTDSRGGLPPLSDDLLLVLGILYPGLRAGTDTRLIKVMSAYAEK